MPAAKEQEIMNEETIDEVKFNKILTKISKSLKTDIDFMVKNGVEIILHSDSKKCNRESFENYVHDIKVSSYLPYENANGKDKVFLEDAFLLYAVHTLGIATTDSLCSYLEYLKWLYPKKQIPKAEKKHINSRLISLARKGLILKNDFLHIDGDTGTGRKNTEIYICRSYGHVYFTKQLDTFVLYDQSMIWLKELEICKRLNSNLVAIAFLQSRYLNSLNLNCRPINYENKEAIFSYYVYSHVMLEDKKEERRVEFIIEPIHFYYDPAIHTKEENEDNLKLRLKNIQGTLKENYVGRNIKVIFLFENLSTIKYFREFCTKNDFNFDNQYCTSDVILKRSSNKLNESFLKITTSNDKMKLIPEIDFWAFN